MAHRAVLELTPHSETRQKHYTMFVYFVMPLTSVVVDIASFRKMSESFDHRLQISKLTTLLQISVKFMQFISIFMHGADSLFPGPLLYQGLKKSSYLFSESIKTPKLLFSSVTFSLLCFSQHKP